jgi:hypothetical protein
VRTISGTFFTSTVEKVQTSVFLAEVSICDDRPTVVVHGDRPVVAVHSCPVVTVLWWLSCGSCLVAVVLRRGMPFLPSRDSCPVLGVL